jgi:uncharacterized protein YutE (UPF0331/DUF86 family)
MSERYFKKIEILERELEYINSHEITGEVTERAALYSLQTCIESGMDIIAMKVKGLGLVVADDYTNIEKLIQGNVITLKEGELLKEFNGIRNAVVHKYNRLDMDIIKEALERIAEFAEVIFKIAEQENNVRYRMPDT